MSKYIVIYERSENGWGAYAPNRPGIGVVGATLEAVRHLIQEGIEFPIEAL